MKKLLILLLVVGASFLIYRYGFKKDEPKGGKPKPIAVSKHSNAFNQSVDTMLGNYFAMTDAFVNWDMENANKNAVSLQTSLNGLKMGDLQKDSTIYQTAIVFWNNSKADISEIASATDWAAKRKALHNLSDNMRTLLQTIKYDQAVVYWQECPMAFGEGMAANWLSNKEEVVNPYLGNKDPQYGNSMLHCGETKMKIDFTTPDTTVVK